ncbi:hypothetical protein JOM56_014007 [Amanita muscaria]
MAVSRTTRCGRPTTVPGSGLSSSAALVVSSSLAFLAINGKLASTSRLAIASERRVGVNIGGMDQAAPVLPPNAMFLSSLTKR